VVSARRTGCYGNIGRSLRRDIFRKGGSRLANSQHCAESRLPPTHQRAGGWIKCQCPPRHGCDSRSFRSRDRALPKDRKNMRRVNDEFATFRQHRLQCTCTCPRSIVCHTSSVRTKGWCVEIVFGWPGLPDKSPHVLKAERRLIHAEPG
jgi:hypothetical protein